MRVIGYAKTAHHGSTLAAARPDGLIDSMDELADALSKSVRRDG